VITTVLAFVLTLGVLIVVHEYGHYRVAVACGVKVMRFSVGFGRVIWRRQRDQDSTEFVLCALPLGGYVRMLDEREAEVPAHERHRAFNRQSLGRRSAIVAAGPAANLLLAVLISSALFTLLHFSPDKNLFAHLNSFLFSVFTCYLVLIYRNVWAAAGFHAGWNWLIGTGFDLPLTGIDLKIAPLLVQLTPVGPSWLNGGSGGPENTLACTVVTFIAILVAHRVLIVQGRNKVA
jgi:membrane-associated protease RseP (regulator of RpoE activity)